MGDGVRRNVRTLALVAALSTSGCTGNDAEVKVSESVVNFANWFDYIGPDTLTPGQDAPFDVEVFSWKGRPDRSQVAGHSVVAYDD